MSPKKRCPKCGQNRALEHFWRDAGRPDGLQIHCKPCMRAYREANAERVKETQRRWREKNRPKLNAAERARRMGKAAYIASVKENRPCADCGGNFPVPCMEFDHVRGEKVNAVANMARSGGFSLESIKREIAKCDLVCANCHRIRHYHQGRGAA